MGLKIDSACKDVGRLCFVSYDPNLRINPGAKELDVESWAPPKEIRKLPPSGARSGTPGGSGQAS